MLFRATSAFANNNLKKALYCPTYMLNMYCDIVSGKENFKLLKQKNKFTPLRHPMTVINCNFNIPTFFFGLLIIDLKQYIKEIIGLRDLAFNSTRV